MYEQSAGEEPTTRKINTKMLEERLWREGMDLFAVFEAGQSQNTASKLEFNKLPCWQQRWLGGNAVKLRCGANF